MPADATGAGARVSATFGWIVRTVGDRAAAEHRRASIVGRRAGEISELADFNLFHEVSERPSTALTRSRARANGGIFLW